MKICPKCLRVSCGDTWEYFCAVDGKRLLSCGTDAAKPYEERLKAKIAKEEKELVGK